MFSLNKVLKDIATKLVNILHKADVVDNLTSTSTDKPLSANQGKVLKGQIDTIDARFVYSTTEKRIGTWVDGKPLYRRCVKLGSVITINHTTWTSLTSYVTFYRTIDTIVLCWGIRGKDGAYPLNIATDNTGSGATIFNALSARSNAGVGVETLVIYYTKTTD